MPPTSEETKNDSDRSRDVKRAGGDAVWGEPDEAGRPRMPTAPTALIPMPGFHNVPFVLPNIAASPATAQDRPGRRRLQAMAGRPLAAACPFTSKAGDALSSTRRGLEAVPRQARLFNRNVS
jgi:hypothetical protein